MQFLDLNTVFDGKRTIRVYFIWVNLRKKVLGYLLFSVFKHTLVLSTK